MVLSDVHGETGRLAAVLEWAAAGGIGCGAFLGDGLSELDGALARSGFSGRWHRVRGNNDFGRREPEAAVFPFAGLQVFICHGHRYRGTESLLAAAGNRGAALALFGHSHVPFLKKEGEILLVNPGSIGNPRSVVGSTFALLESGIGPLPEASFWGVDRAGKVRALFSPG